MTTALVRVGSASFGAAVARKQAAGHLVVQPRMGFADTARMRAGLIATKRARAATAGTITLDSYTRVGDDEAVRAALAAGADLNGYPIVGHGPDATRALVDGILDADFPIQVRHGSADPRHIVAALLASGLDATEGGPVSYCLPYSRMPLVQAVDHWARCCDLLAAARSPEREPHLETFGGCMMGQLCPPAMLVALSVLEGMFFWQHGIASMSFSYAQQTHAEQDEEAVRALRRLVAEFVPGAQSHIVIYTYMGVFPRSAQGAARLLEESARLAVRAGAARLIVKTTAEAFRIPTIEENVSALEYAALIARRERERPAPPVVADTGIYRQARAMVEAVMELRVGRRPGAGRRVRARLSRRAVLPAPGQREPHQGLSRPVRTPAVAPDRVAADPRHRRRADLACHDGGRTDHRIVLCGTQIRRRGARPVPPRSARLSRTPHPKETHMTQIEIAGTDRRRPATGAARAPLVTGDPRRAADAATRSRRPPARFSPPPTSSSCSRRSSARSPTPAHAAPSRSTWTTTATATS